ncbi:MAG: CHAD domain-containing protein [Gammaproteobacteria bacterium]
MEQAKNSLTRMRHSSDPHALHDFRVALRRLRAWLSSFKAVLAVSGGTRDRLRRLSRRTNRARDAEAALAWLEKPGRDTDPHSSSALVTVQKELTKELDNTNKSLAEHAHTDWESVARRLGKELSDRATDADDAMAFGGTWAQALELALAEATDRRRAAAAEANSVQIHHYRIAVKRVHYLMEPLSGTLPEAARVLRQVKYSQDRAGKINDLHNMIAWLRRRAQEISAEQGTSAFELGIKGQEDEAQRISVRAHDYLWALIAAGRIANSELDARTNAFVKAGARNHDPGYAHGTTNIARNLRTLSSHSE